jgi:hypothetical protein
VSAAARSWRATWKAVAAGGPHQESRELVALRRGIEILENGSANLNSGQAPEICCAPTRECLLSQYEKQVFRASRRRLENERELHDALLDAAFPPVFPEQEQPDAGVADNTPQGAEKLGSIEPLLLDGNHGRGSHGWLQA